MKLPCLALIQRKAVEADDARRRPHPCMPFQDDHALVDRGVLAQVDLSGLVASQQRMDVKALGTRSCRPDVAVSAMVG